MVALPGPELLAVVSFPSCFCFEKEEPSGASYVDRFTSVLNSLLAQTQKSPPHCILPRLWRLFCSLSSPISLSPT